MPDSWNERHSLQMILASIANPRNFIGDVMAGLALVLDFVQRWGYAGSPIADDG